MLTILENDLFHVICDENGAHLGFNCPLLESETTEDYYLEFNEMEAVSSKQ